MKKISPILLPDSEDHHPLGGSNCERFWNCPGSVRLSNHAPKSKPSFYSAEGTAAHAALSRWLITGAPPEAGTVYKKDGFDIVVDEEMIEAIETAVRYVAEKMAELGIPKYQLEVEKKVKYQALSYQGKKLAGTPDISFYAPFLQMNCIDYKHGAGQKVKAENNKQILYYLTAKWLSLPEIVRNSLEYVEGTIIQPRCAVGSPIETWIAPIDVIETFYRELQAAVKRVENQSDELQPGEWCKFCPAMIICPAIKAQVATQAALDFDDDSPKLPDVATMSIEQAARILDMQPVADAYFKAVHSFVLGSLESNKEVPGYELVEKWGREKFIDQVELERILPNTFIRKRLHLAAPKLLTPNQLKTVLKKEKIEIDLNKLIDRPYNGNAVAKVGTVKRITKTSAQRDYEHVTIDVQE